MKADRCVYFHLRPDTKEIFYIGIGSKRRVNTKNGRNKYWKKIVEICGKPIVLVIADGLTMEQAVELEKFWIKHHGLHRLANISPGGDGVSGFAHSEETRMKIAKLMIGRDKGKQLSEEHKLKISKSCIGRKPTIKTKLKISNTLKGRKIPREIVEKMNIIGRKKSEKELEKLRQANINKTLHTFYHSEYGEIISTRYDLEKKYNLHCSALCGLIKGNRKSHKGWSIVPLC